MSEHNYELQGNLPLFIEVKRSAAVWRQKNSKPSKIWDPETISVENYLDEFYEDQAHVLLEDGIPVAGVVISDPKRYKNDAWVNDLGVKYRRDNALYLDDYCVIGNRIGEGLVDKLQEFIENYAIKLRYGALRCDCDKVLDKLVDTYKRLGFVSRAEHDLGHRISVYMEKELH